jgi:hypothetical protein
MRLIMGRATHVAAICSTFDLEAVCESIDRSNLTVASTDSAEPWKGDHFTSREPAASSPISLEGRERCPS